MGIYENEIINAYRNQTGEHKDIDEVLTYKVPMGAYCLSTFIMYFIVSIDACIFVVGIVGNAIACIVIACSKSMHTPTNYYLFSLSMSDLFLLVVGAPQEIYQIYSPNTYYAGSTLCFLRNWAAEILVNVSVITITAFTFERYLAICRPFVAHAISQVSRVKKLIFKIWLIAILISLPIASQQRYTIEGEKTICEFDERIIPYSLEVSTTLFFIVPFTVITVMYILIAMNLTKTKRMKDIGKNGAQIHARTDNNNKRTVKMLIIIVLAFFLCWAPFHLQRLMTEHFNDVNEDSYTLFDNVYCIVTHVSGITYLLSPVINPLIYSIMSSKFREAFEELLFKAGVSFCNANYYRWRKTLNITKDVSVTNDTAFTTFSNSSNV